MAPSAYNNVFQLFQTPDHVVILNEMVHDARVVPLDNGAHLPPHMRQWHGDSRGRWDCDTLVVETINFTDKTSFRGSTDSLHLVERFTRASPDTAPLRVHRDRPEGVYTTMDRPGSDDHVVRSHV